MRFFLLLTLILPFSLLASGEKPMTTSETIQIETRTDFTDAEKIAFAQAYMKVNQIQQTYRAQLDPEMTEEQMQQVATKANKEIEAAIDGQENMNTTTYRQILMALEGNQELLQDIQNRLENM